MNLKTWVPARTIKSKSSGAVKVYARLAMGYTCSMKSSNQHLKISLKIPQEQADSDYEENWTEFILTSNKILVAIL